MVAFWRDLRMRPPCGEQLGASMPMPAAAAAGGTAAWVHDLAPLGEAACGGGGGGDGDGPQRPAPTLVAPVAVASVWEPVGGAGGAKAPSYDACFQGF